MQYRNLGNSNLKVSALCLGTMMFGDQTAADEAAAIVADAHAHGVNFIDTADVYSKGGAETMLGELLKGQRTDWVLALEQLAQHGLRTSFGIHVGGVDKVHALSVGIGHNGRSLVSGGLVAKHHGAQAQGGNFEVAIAKIAVLHGSLWGRGNN